MRSSDEVPSPSLTPPTAYTSPVFQPLPPRIPCTAVKFSRENQVFANNPKMEKIEWVLLIIFASHPNHDPQLCAFAPSFTLLLLVLLYVVRTADTRARRPTDESRDGTTGASAQHQAAQVCVGKAFRGVASAGTQAALRARPHIQRHHRLHRDDADDERQREQQTRQKTDVEEHVVDEPRHVARRERSTAGAREDARGGGGQVQSGQASGGWKKITTRPGGGWVFRRPLTRSRMYSLSTVKRARSTEVHTRGFIRSDIGGERGAFETVSSSGGGGGSGGLTVNE